MSMSNAALVPAPEPGESSDVSWALESARTQWDKGNMQEALRWISRAADAAEQAGDDDRAMTLAQSAADLKEAIDHRNSASIVPPSGTVSVQPPKPRTRPPPPPSRRQSFKATERTSSPPRPIETAGATMPSPPPSPAVGLEPGTSVGTNQVRVSIKASVRDPSLFFVRLLPNGRAAAAGSHEAVLLSSSETLKSLGIERAHEKVDSDE